MSRNAMAPARAAFRFAMGGGRGGILALLGLVLMLIPSLALADYRVESGDVLQIDVLGAPGLSHRAVVDAAGQIALPVLGEIPAAGMTLSQLREKLSAQLIAKNVVREPQVTVEVSEYRPIYVGGDVTKPGAYPYRIGMNVRDAVALAVGYDLLHLRGRDLMLEGADARGQYNGSTVELAKDTARIARIQAELAGISELDTAKLKDLPVQPTILREIVQAERQQLTADNDDTARQKAYFERMISQTKDQLSTLTGAAARSRAAYEQALQNVTRASELLKRGLVAKERVETAQSAAVTAQGNLTDVTARAAQARQDLTNYTRQLQQMDAQRRINLLQDLQQTVAAAATARSQLRAAAQKVLYTNVAQQQLARGTLAKRVSIVIYRQSGTGQQQRLRADETTTLMPGDDIQVTSEYDFSELLKGAASDDGSRGSRASAPAPPAGGRPNGARPDMTLMHPRHVQPRGAARTVGE